MKKFLPAYQIEKCIPKADLEDGVTYKGHCRNASVAHWDAAIEKFIYQRAKFGCIFNEEIDHPEDDRGFDCFVPWEKYTGV